MMEQHKIEILLRAEQPIAHAEGTVGNTSVVMRRKVRMSDGRWTKVPIVTGDTMRHGLREAASYAYLQAAGLLDAGSLSESALRLLFSGGMVTGAAGDAMRLDEERQWRDFAPHLALLGGCIGNRIVPGKVECGDAWLVCDETAHLVPAWIREHLEAQGVEPSGAKSHVELVQRVRMDPTLNPEKRNLLTSGDSEKVERRLLASDAASHRDDARGKDDAKSTMMPFTYETVAAGSLFYWTLTVRTHSQIERDALSVMLSAFLAHARVGGKRGTGHGLLRAVEARGMRRTGATPAGMDALALDSETSAPEIQRWIDHVASRREAIRSWLSTVVA
jgi:hypothetical protein